MYDVIVVGAGPAGSSAAYHCAKKGLKTLLLERERIPRDKRCGGMVSSECISSLGFHEMVERRTDRLRIVLNYDDLGSRNVDGCLVLRHRFDTALVRRAQGAGAEVGDGLAVRKISLGEEVTVSCGPTEYRSRVLIGADGVDSLVRESCGLESQRVKPDRIISFVLEDSIDNKRLDDVLGNGEHTYFNTYFFTFFPGYAWIFPKDEMVNVGMGTVLGAKKDLSVCFDDFLGKAGLDFLDKSKITAYLIPFRPLPILHSGRVLVVGDAGGLVNPFTGGGIELGLESGERAAQASHRALERGDISLLSSYQEAMRPVIRGLVTKTRLINLAVGLMDKGLDSPVADRVALTLFNRMA
jgi:geranylgeranyl reductase family protein